MATLSTLLAAGSVEEINLDLPEGTKQERYVYALPHVRTWLTKTLPGLPPEDESGLLSPYEQVIGRLEEFGSGISLREYRKSHIMKPSESGVWVIKTHDIRLYGWFCQPKHLILANADTKANLVRFRGMTTGYVTNTIHRRGQLGLEPAFVSGDYDDVF